MTTPTFENIFNLLFLTISLIFAILCLIFAVMGAGLISKAFVKLGDSRDIILKAVMFFGYFLGGVLLFCSCEIFISIFLNIFNNLLSYHFFVYRSTLQFIFDILFMFLLIVPLFIGFFFGFLYPNKLFF